MARKRKEGTRKRVPPPGERVIRSYSLQRALLEELNDFAAAVKAATGMHVDRSKLVACFAELLKEHRAQINLNAIDSLESLRAEIRKGFCKKAAPRR